MQAKFCLTLLLFFKVRLWKILWIPWSCRTALLLECPHVLYELETAWQNSQHRGSGTQKQWDLLRSDSGSPENTLLKFASKDGAASSKKLTSSAFVNGFLCCWLNFVDILEENISPTVYVMRVGKWYHFFVSFLQTKN